MISLGLESLDRVNQGSEQWHHSDHPPNPVFVRNRAGNRSARCSVGRSPGPEVRGTQGGVPRSGVPGGGFPTVGGASIVPLTVGRMRGLAMDDDDDDEHD